MTNKKTVSFKTFGCKQNQYDTDFLKQVFREKGYEICESGPADIFVINTCTVTSRSAAKCRQAIRAAARSGAKVVVTGCYPQVAKDELVNLPGVIAVTGVRNRKGLVDVVERALTTGEKVVDVQPHEKDASFEETPVTSRSLTRAFLKIQEGCDDYCTYCIVPYARGPSRSRPMEDILWEARRLVEVGYKEIVLTGTHLGLYGKDLFSSSDMINTWDRPKTPDLPLVIRNLTEIEGLLRLRLSSLEPHDVTPALIHCLRYPQVCNHLHLPLQSGSDEILGIMGRPYDSSTFLDIVEEARKVSPNIGISSDIMVGFPGENEKEFEDTLKVMESARFSRVHVFRYSPRPGTPASNFEGQVPEKEKERRSKAAIALGRKLSLEFNQRLLGKRVEVLVEEDRSREGFLQGLTRNYVRVWFQGPDELKGEIVEVRVCQARHYGVFASV